MNTAIRLVTVTVLSMMAFALQCQNVEVPVDEIFTVSYYDSFSSDGSIGSEKLQMPMLPRNERYSSQTCVISLNYDNVPESMYRSVEYAKGIWQTCILEPLAFSIDIKTEELQDVDVYTEVSYTNKNNVSVPVASTGDIETDGAAGVIIINSNVDWDTSIGENIDPSKPNLAFAIMRGIARILGFGSSASLSGNSYRFAKGRNFSNFDKLVMTSDGHFLTELPARGNLPVLQEFIDYPGRRFFVGNSQENYELAVTPMSNLRPPFCELTEGLMSANIGVGDYYLRLDDATWNIMEMLGWTVRRYDSLSIKCPDDVDGSGLLSPYSNHDFYIDGIVDSSRVKSPEWKLRIPRKTNPDFYIDIPDEGFMCPMESLTELYDEDEFIADSEGVITAKLEFSCYVDSIPVKLFPYTVNFETKPKIKAARITDIHFSEDGYYYKADYEVEYSGDDSIEVFTEEEYSFIANTWIIREPGFAKGTTDWIDTEGYAWINFRVKNKENRAVYIIEIEPYAENWYPLDDPEQYISLNDLTEVVGIPLQSDLKYIEVFDIMGNKISEGSCAEVISEVSYKGIVIVKCNYGDKIRTFKTMLR